jgi:hypothetical protein
MATQPESVCFEEIDPAHGEWWGLDPRLHASAAEGERMYSLAATEIAGMVEAAIALPRDQITALNFASQAGFGNQPCWTECQNIEDLRSDYWKGDLPWEDPFCPFCAWRSPGVTRQLAGIKGREWMEALAAHWTTFLPLAYQYKTGKSLREILDEWEGMKTAEGK